MPFLRSGSYDPEFVAREHLFHTYVGDSPVVSTGNTGGNIKLFP